MAKVKAFGREQVKMFAGTIDFYYWRGIPVARKWPKKPTPPYTEKQAAAMQAMAQSRQDLKQLSGKVISAWRQQAQGLRAPWLDEYTKQYMLYWGMYHTLPHVLQDYSITEEGDNYKIEAEFLRGNSPHISYGDWRDEYSKETEEHRGVREKCFCFHRPEDWRSALPIVVEGDKVYGDGGGPNYREFRECLVMREGDPSEVLREAWEGCESESWNPEWATTAGSRVDWGTMGGVPYAWVDEYRVELGWDFSEWFEGGYGEPSICGIDFNVFFENCPGGALFTWERADITEFVNEGWNTWTVPYSPDVFQIEPELNWGTVILHGGDGEAGYWGSSEPGIGQVMMGVCKAFLAIAGGCYWTIPSLPTFSGKPIQFMFTNGDGYSVVSPCIVVSV